MKKKKITTNDFITKAEIVHGKKYDYGKTLYTKSKCKVTIVCNIHGEFKQLANAHLNGQGCYQCGLNRLSNNKYKSKFLKKILPKAHKIHGNKYNYRLISSDTYLGTSKKHAIICPVHGIFYQTLDQHVTKSKGCKKCAIKTRNTKNCFGWTFTNWKEKCKNKIPKFYIVRFSDINESFLKIGITTQQTIQQRFSNRKGYKIEVINVTTGSPKYIWDLEHKLLKILKPYKYIPLKEFEGRHECIVDDVDPVINALNNTR